jgi:hypothetical protein
MLKRSIVCFTEEMTLARDLAAQVDSGTNLADILSSALPPEKRDSTVGQESSKREEKSSDSSVSTVLTSLCTAKLH